MAEGWSQEVRCRYYSNGMCRKGENCRYLHQGPYSSNSGRVAGHFGSSGNASQPNQPSCWFFQRGSCAFGQRCRFMHFASGEERPEAASSWSHSPNSSGTSNLKNRKAAQEHSKTQQINSLRKSIFRRQETSFNEGIGERFAENWVKAPEFIPAKDEMNVVPDKFYAEVLSPDEDNKNAALRLRTNEYKLCSYSKAGNCKYGEKCPYVHSDLCDLCEQPCLDPFDQEQRKKHITDCIKQHEEDMELSFAVAQSKDKTCGICFEVVMEKSPREQRFGILPNCNHCFCLTCIKKWRQAKQFDNKIIRACPECRVKSDFVCPSIYWVDTKEKKEKLITDYKAALSVRKCKYFKCGQGKCPFGNKCFYLHALPDGTKCDVGPPRRRRQRRRLIDSDSFPEMFLASFMDIADLLQFSDSDESGWSDYELIF